MVTNCTKTKTALCCGEYQLLKNLGNYCLGFFLIMSPPITPCCVNVLVKEYGKTGKEIALDALGVLKGSFRCAAIAVLLHLWKCPLSILVFTSLLCLEQLIYLQLPHKVSE